MKAVDWLTSQAERTATVSPEIHLRSYDQNTGLESHAFAQFVLPVHGSLEIEVSGRGTQIGTQACVFVAPEALHDQIGPVGNQVLIVDVPARILAPGAMETLSQQLYFPLDAAATHLTGYMMHLLAQTRPSASTVDNWLHLLLGSLLPKVQRHPARLDTLLAQLCADPFMAWSVCDMAKEAGMSASSLHRAFVAQTGKTPNAYLASLRMSRIVPMIETSRVPLSEIAYRCGFSDQSALTRAVRMATGKTPAQLRKG